MRPIPIFVCSMLLCIQSFAQDISVSFPDSLLSKPFTGSILLYLSKTAKEPRLASSLLDNSPCIRVNVVNIHPDEKVRIKSNALAFPVDLNDLERGTYYVQVVWDRNMGGQFNTWNG